MKTKKCTCCDEVKSTNEFYRIYRLANSFFSQCKKCLAIKRRGHGLAKNTEAKLDRENKIIQVLPMYYSGELSLFDISEISKSSYDTVLQSVTKFSHSKKNKFNDLYEKLKLNEIEFKEMANLLILTYDQLRVKIDKHLEESEVVNVEIKSIDKKYVADFVKQQRDLYNGINEPTVKDYINLPFIQKQQYAS